MLASSGRLEPEEQPRRETVAEDLALRVARREERRLRLVDRVERLGGSLAALQVDREPGQRPSPAGRVVGAGLVTQAGQLVHGIRADVGQGRVDARVAARARAIDHRSPSNLRSAGGEVSRRDGPVPS